MARSPALLLLLALLGLAQECLGGPQLGQQPMRQFLVLREPALAALDPADVRAGVEAPFDPERRRRLQAEQNRVAETVEALGGHVVLRLETLVNALVVDLSSEGVSAVSGLPEVRGLFPDRPMRRTLTSSVPWIGAPAAVPVPPNVAWV
ncbi:MAG: hypothetical protein ACKO3H_01025 [Verrucomicrobiota bacterium]